MRTRAERQLRKQHAGGSRIETKVDAQRVLHELQVHQVELELQNEELKQSKAEVDALLEIYTDLYDFAPVGYCTLRVDGTIQLVNLTAENLVAIERAQLIGRRLGLFVSPKHRKNFSAFLERVFANETKQSGEFEIFGEGPMPRIVNIEAQRLRNGFECRAAIVDVTERKRAAEVLHHAAVLAASNAKLVRSENKASRLLKKSHILQQQLRFVSHRTLLAQENLRREISRDLHDKIVQFLIGININLEAFAKVAERNPRNIRRKIVPVRRQVGKAVEIVHQFARDLRPAMLDHLGLISALHSYLKGFSKRTTIKVRLNAFAGVESMENEKLTMLYRVAQEALTNVEKHANASLVRVEILKTTGGVSLEIYDNGKAFDVVRSSDPKFTQRLGLTSMRERVEMFNGRFRIVSIPGTGTTVRAEVPFSKSRMRK